MLVFQFASAGGGRPELVRRRRPLLRGSPPRKMWPLQLEGGLTRLGVTIQARGVPASETQTAHQRTLALHFRSIHPPHHRSRYESASSNATSSQPARSPSPSINDELSLASSSEPTRCPSPKASDADQTTSDRVGDLHRGQDPTDRPIGAREFGLGGHEDRLSLLSPTTTIQNHPRGDD